MADGGDEGGRQSLARAFDSLNQLAGELVEMRRRSLLLQERTQEILSEMVEMQQQLRLQQEWIGEEARVTQKASNEANGKTVAAGTIDQADLE